jgi:AraC-like DNA-binding protein
MYRSTPFEYLQRRRMAKAHRLLIQGTSSVKEVAAACGYDDPYYFSRMFRRQYDCTPRDVRLGKVKRTP